MPETSSKPFLNRNMTVIERKRLQWQQEREEMQVIMNYNPWGRPGAGAPCNLNVATPIIEPHNNKQEHNFNRYDQTITIPIGLVSEDLPSSNVPAAMRSSFIVGESSPSIERYKDLKIHEKKQWLSDLEKQIDQKTVEHSISLPGPYIKSPDLGHNIHPASVNIPASLNKPQPVYASNALSLRHQTYLHGQNITIDPQTRSELEFKRQKEMEHQAALMAQIREKQKEKQKLKEDCLKEQIYFEHLLNKDTSEPLKDLPKSVKSAANMGIKKPPVDTMVVMLERARLEAERDRAERRIQHLRKGGHDVTGLESILKGISRRIDSTYKPSVPEDANVTEFNDSCEMSRDVKDVKDDVIDHLDNIEDCEDLSCQPNRKEVGTQTVLKKGITVEKISLDIESKQEGRKPVTQKNDKSNKGIRNRKLTNRPQWGYQNVDRKTAVKQSDRIIWDSKKKLDSKIRRNEHEQKLLRMVAANSCFIPAEKTHRNHNDAVDIEHGNRIVNANKLLKEAELPVNKSSGVNNLISVCDDEVMVNEVTKKHKSTDIDQMADKNPNTELADLVSGQQNLCLSPVIPALRHKLTNLIEINQNFDTESKMYIKSPNLYQHKHDINKYNDVKSKSEPLNGLVDSNYVDYLPYRRSTEVLDPCKMVSSAPTSRETSAAKAARIAYLGGQIPGVLGKEMEDIDDSKYETAYISLCKDPILNPDVIKNHPTNRQDIIIQQLKNLKKNLMRRRLEAESYLPLSDITKTENSGHPSTTGPKYT